MHMYLMISAYSLSLPLLSLHLRNMTEASTFAGENVFGSFRREITLRRMVLFTHKHRWNTVKDTDAKTRLKLWPTTVYKNPGERETKYPKSVFNFTADKMDQ